MLLSFIHLININSIKIFVCENDSLHAFLCYYIVSSNAYHGHRFFISSLSYFILNLIICTNICIYKTYILTFLDFFVDLIFFISTSLSKNSNSNTEYYV